MRASENGQKLLAVRRLQGVHGRRGHFPPSPFLRISICERERHRHKDTHTHTKTTVRLCKTLYDHFLALTKPETQCRASCIAAAMPEQGLGLSSGPKVFLPVLQASGNSSSRGGQKPNVRASEERPRNPRERQGGSPPFFRLSKGSSRYHAAPRSSLISCPGIWSPSSRLGERNHIGILPDIPDQLNDTTGRDSRL